MFKKDSGQFFRTLRLLYVYNQSSHPSGTPDFPFLAYSDSHPKNVVQLSQVTIAASPNFPLD